MQKILDSIELPKLPFIEDLVSPEDIEERRSGHVCPAGQTGALHAQPGAPGSGLLPGCRGIRAGREHPSHHVAGAGSGLRPSFFGPTYRNMQIAR